MIKTFMSCVFFVFCAAAVTAQWPAATQQARPWTRWWWMGSAVDSTGIATQMQLFHEAHFGGVEIVPIYGAKGAEQKFRKYLSPAWMRLLDYSVTEARKQDMGVYLAVGTGWPIGGPQVAPQHAAAKLIIQQYAYNAGDKTPLTILVKDTKQAGADPQLAALSAYSDQGVYLDLTDKVAVDGTLQWKPKNGNWQLYAAFNGKTLQKVKRAAPGGEGFTLDHFNAAALKEYLSSFDLAFGKDLHGVQAFYNDSYEVYGADWTPAFFKAFREKRGYDLKRCLNLLVSADSTDAVSRVKSDYRETMSDLMLEQFAAPLNDWSHSKGALSLNQAHGAPGNLLDLYAAVDIPETESFGSSAFSIKGLRRDSADIRNVDPDPDMMKFASSAAHAMGHNLVSCETFTWLGEHFKTSWSQCKPEAEQVWLAGVNHIFFHGTTYSPADVPWPGWLFYASVEFTPSNSLWPHLKGLNEYITRCQSVLQSGQPDNELLVYWPVYDAWHKAKGRDMPLRVHNVDEWLYETSFHENIRSLQQKGYALDFASDRMLASLQYKDSQLQVTDRGAKSKVLLISRCGKMPLATLKNIYRIAAAGATVVLQDVPEDMPGLEHSKADKNEWQRLTNTLKAAKRKALVVLPVGQGRIILSESVEEGLQYVRIQPEQLVSAGLKFIRRKITDGKYYFLVNHTGSTIDTVISLQVQAKAVQLLDPQSGRTGWAVVNTVDGKTDIRVQLQSGESLFLRTKETEQEGQAWTYYKETAKIISLNGPWELHFGEGGPQLPSNRKLVTLQDWTAFEDAHHFSGTGSYSTTVRLDKKSGAAYQLELKGVHESARVWINNQDAGIVWANPFIVDISPYVKQGTNSIRIEIANLMANRVRYMDRQKISWRNYHEINFVNINYKPFDASAWNVMPSGLSGPVQIREMKKEQ